METLARSSWKVIFNQNRDRCFSSSRDVLSRGQIPFLRFPEHVQIGSSHSISLQHNRIYSIFAPSVSSSEPQTHLQNEETQMQEQSKTVHVKFQLQKECSFGEQFYIIGDDPIFGSWEPSSAIPLEWSDGHVWTVELDIPIEKSIQFKFILKRISGSILWQPEPNRILQTWETENKITVSEDWDDAELQKIIEEGLTFNQNEESTINSEMLIVAENMAQPSSGITNPMENALAEKSMAIVAENITEPKENHQVNINNEVFGARSITYGEEHVAIPSNDLTMGEKTLGNNGRAVTVEEGNLVSLEGGPVLVPGLTTLPTGDIEVASPRSDIEVASPTEVKKNSFGSDEAEEHNVSEIQLDLKEEVDSPRLQETTEMMHGDNEELNGSEQVENPRLAKEQDQPNSESLLNDVLENDIHWGRRTLQKFLTNLGIL